MEGFSYCLEGDTGIVYGPAPGADPAIAGNAFGPTCVDESVPYRRVVASFKAPRSLIPTRFVSGRSATSSATCLPY